MALADLFTDIADAIREKDGTTETIVANDFPARIQAIETGGGATGLAHGKIFEAISGTGMARINIAKMKGWV